MMELEVAGQRTPIPAGEMVIGSDPSCGLRLPGLAAAQAVVIGIGDGSVAVRRVGASFSPPWSVSGGSHSANCVEPRGDASSATATTGSPVRRDADPAGSPAVADASTNVGEAPYFSQTRCSRRSTLATCDPKTPR